MNNNLLYSDDNCDFELLSDGNYRLSFFKENHWHGDITFSPDGQVLFNDLSEDVPNPELNKKV